MIRLKTEQHLEALATQMIGGSGKVGPASDAELADLRAAILTGDDPLGSEFMSLRPAEERRARGAIYTPRAIVEAMIAWAASEPGPSPKRIVDPGSGSGRFLIAAAQAFPTAQLLAIEIDPLAVKLLRANAAAAGFADRLTVHTGDYQTFPLAPIEGRTLFVGNPPYVRHHQISDAAKRWFAGTAKRLGSAASKLAGLHLHFFLRTRELGQAGDIGIFITSSEWMDVNYGSVLRHMLTDGLGGTALHVLNPAANPFAGTMTTSAIACFRIGNRPKRLTIREVTTAAELIPLSGGKEIEWEAAERAPRWSTLARTTSHKPVGGVELGELFRVHRGQVTGCNAVWIAGSETWDLPAHLLVPAVTRAQEVFACDGELSDTRHLRRVVDLPTDLDTLSETERRKVDQFLKWARSCGAHESYVAKNRRRWWSVGLREPPPIICTYMARRPPAFARNSARASLVNIAHGLYPIEPIGDTAMAAIVSYLRRTVSVTEGRTYAGGLVKFEPREVERLRIPAPETPADVAAA